MKRISPRVIISGIIFNFFFQIESFRIISRNFLNKSLFIKILNFFSKNAKDLASANLGQKIRFYRQVAGLTQKQLADACDKNESTIRNYELGNRYPDDDTIYEIATALEISPYLLSSPKPDVAASALQFLFNMEKYILKFLPIWM